MVFVFCLSSTHSCAPSAYTLAHLAVLTIVHLDGTSILSLYNVRGPRGNAAAVAMMEPAGEGDDEVWVPYHCSTCGGRGHFSSTCKWPHNW